MDRGAWWAAVHGVATSCTQLSDFTFIFHFRALQKEMATHSSVLAWRIPGTVEPGGLPSMGLHRVGHDWSDLAVTTLNYKVNVAECVHEHWNRVLKNSDFFLEIIGFQLRGTPAAIQIVIILYAAVNDHLVIFLSKPQKKFTNYYSTLCLYWHLSIQSNSLFSKCLHLQPYFHKRKNIPCN